LAKTKTIENLFIYLAIYSDLLPVLIFFLFLKRIKKEKSAEWIIISYLLFDFLINIALLYYVIPYKYHNRTYPVATFFESLFFAYFFYLVVKKNKLRKAIVATSIILSLTSLIYYFYTYYYTDIPLKRSVYLDSVPIAIETIAIFLFSFFYFFEQINDTENLFVYNQPSFWNVLGILIYLAGSFFVYISANSISLKQLLQYWMITNIASIIKNIFFVIAILLTVNQTLNKKPLRKNPSYTLN
jgi:hypothetical protein